AYEAFDAGRKGYVTKEDLLSILACSARELERVFEAAGFDAERTHRVDLDGFSKLLHCSRKTIIDFPREDSTSEDEIATRLETAELLERDAYFAQLDEYDEELSVTDGIRGSNTLQLPIRGGSGDEQFRTFLRRMRTWPLFYPLYSAYTFLPSYDDYN
ncbi:hypothetical protein Pmar_PMAR014241, partial [Perkinsus marinus ATCC 50983]